MNNLTEIVKEKLNNIDGFIKSNNYDIIKVDDNYCEMEGLITKTSLNHLDIVHGGYIFGLADTTAGIAAMTEGRNVVTVDSNINYLKKANGEKIIAVARVLKTGKNISVYEVLINNENNELIAKATMTYFML